MKLSFGFRGLLLEEYEASLQFIDWEISDYVEDLVKEEDTQVDE